MSLWTPSGEHPVDRNREGQPASAEPPPGPVPGDDGGEDPSLEDLTPEQRAQVEEMTRQMQEAQARMLRMPAAAVVGQEALQFYELAAVYLSQEPPRLDDAKLAIDAFAAVVERVGDRLAQAEQPLRQALNQIQLAFVQVSNGVSGTDAGNPG
ncbi:MAG TPA: hypothetical protein VGJ86_24520 [Acidimicrobiales bacterium]